MNSRGHFCIDAPKARSPANLVCSFLPLLHPQTHDIDNLFGFCVCVCDYFQNPGSAVVILTALGTGIQNESRCFKIHVFDNNFSLG